MSRFRMGLAVALATVATSVTGAVAAAEGVPSPRPGDAVTVEGRTGGCTLGFLFAGSDGATYASTAGHCILGDDETTKTWRAGKGPTVSLAGDATRTGPIGRVVFAEFLPTEENDWLDFALVKLDRGVGGDGRVRDLGGPTGVYSKQADEPVRLAFYGKGTGVGDVLPSRDLLALNTKRASHVYAHGVAAPGDSGAPVLTADGEAVGLILGAGGNAVGVGLGTASVGHDAAPLRIGRLGPVLADAARTLKLRFRLALAAG